MFKIPKSNQMKTTAPDPQSGSNLRWGTEDAPLFLSSHFNTSGVVTWGHRLERREQEETLKTHHRGSKVHPPGPPRAWSGESFKANNSRGGAVSTRPAIGPLMRAHCLPLSLCLSVHHVLPLSVFPPGSIHHSLSLMVCGPRPQEQQVAFCCPPAQVTLIAFATAGNWSGVCARCSTELPGKSIKPYFSGFFKVGL